MKRFWRVLPAVLFLFLLSLGVQAAKKAEDLFYVGNFAYVGDFAGVISGEREDYFALRSQALEKETGAQIVVVTVSSLEEYTVEEYANELFNGWGIGKKGEDSGVLILLSTGERKIRVEVGYGLEGALNDAKVGRLIDRYAIPFFQEDAFDEGLYELYNAILPLVYEEYGLDVPDEVDIPSGVEDMDEEDEDADIASVVTLIILIFLLVMFNNTRSRRRRGSTFGRMWMGSGPSHGGFPPPPPPHTGVSPRGGFSVGGRRGGGGRSGGGRSGGGGASRGF